MNRGGRGHRRFDAAHHGHHSHDHTDRDHGHRGGATRGRGSSWNDQRGPRRANREVERCTRPNEMPATTMMMSYDDYEVLREMAEATPATIMALLQEPVMRTSFTTAITLPPSQSSGQRFVDAMVRIVSFLLDESNHPQWTKDVHLNRHIFAWLCRESCPLSGPTRGRGFVVMLRAAPEDDYCEAAEAHLARHGDAAETAWYADLRGAVDAARASVEQHHVVGESEPTRRYYNCEYGADPPELALESVFPTMKELQDPLPKKTIHRSMKGVCVHQRLTWEQRNVNIRTQFRLVKEDFVASLRESYNFLAELQLRWDIPAVHLSQEIRRALRNRRDHGDRIRVYYYVGVRLRGYEVHPRVGIVAVFQLDAQANRHISAKRLMQGNLILLVPQADGFRQVSAKNMIMGTVVGGAPVKPGRDAPSVSDTLLLDINNMETLMDLCARGLQDYVAIESTVFFTPCERVLTSLRKLDQRNVEGRFPPILATVLTGVPAEPPYLQNKLFDLSRSIALQNVNETTWDPLRGTAENFAPWSHELEKGLREGVTAVLDTTQRDALPYALRHSVAVIQGTPGTGKTFIGVKLLQVLYENLPHDAPIVVMCQTNHAVDSFLQDVLKFVKREHVARIGYPKDERLNDLKVQPWFGFAFSPDDRARAEELIKIQKDIWNAKGSSRALEKLVRDHLLKCYDRENDVRNFLQWMDGAAKKSTNISEVRGRLRRESSSLSAMRSMQQLQQREGSLNDELQRGWKRICDNCVALGLSVDESEAIQELACAEETEAEMQTYLAMYDSVEDAREFKTEHLNNLRALQQIVADFKARRNHEEKMREVKSSIQKRHEQAALVERLQRELAALEAGDPPLDDGDGILEWWRQRPGATPLRLFQNYVTDGVAGAGAPGGEIDERAAQFNAELRAQEAARREENEMEEVRDGNAAVIPFTPSAAERLERIRQAAAYCVGRNTSKPDRDDAVTMLIEEVYYGLNDKMRDIVSRTRRDCAVGARSMASFDGKHVIGGTTVGMMKILPLIASLGVRVMFVEEAAEVLESHILACITRRLEHLFLIGDHKQLKPQVEEFELETRLNLGVSLMERLAIVGYPLVTLTTQRRMHPEISVLTKKYYKIDGVEVVDHPCTDRSLIRGLGPGDRPRRLVFVSYTPTEARCEKQDPNLDSPYNEYEIGMAAATFHFLNVVHGISATVLVPYTAQKLHARRYFEQRRLPLRISTVDEYQGDEDTAIILSLTRTDRPGFLNAQNRSCVALSRARDLFVVIGARSVVESPKCTNDMLREFVAHCDRVGATMAEMQVHCPWHQTAIHFASWEEYESQGHGKCSKQCDRQRECGHVCRALCHGLRDHKLCGDPCARRGAECDPPRTCAHPCVKKCSDLCGLCVEPVTIKCKDCQEPQVVPCHRAEIGEQDPCTALRNLDAACGHKVQATCHEHSSGVAHRKCREVCNQTMSCGHVCGKTCHHGRDDDHKDATGKCEKLRRDKAPCGHSMEFKCNASLRGKFPLCKEACTRTPPCGLAGHACQDVCGRSHRCRCTATVSLTFGCGHTVTAPCANQPSQCLEQCNTTLPCGHPCGEVCGVCKQRAFHRCNQRCSKPLLCRHECGHGCDDPCDELCQQPCLAQPCKHGSGCSGNHPCGECAFDCQEPCLWQCPHQRCEKRCFEVCERPVCRLRCEKMLACGHQCAGLCGEECLDYCPQCYAASPETYLRGELVSWELYDEDYERLMRGLYTDEGDEGGLLHRMPCCSKILRVVEVEKALKSKLTGEVVMLGCPLCNTPLLADDFRRCGSLVRRTRQQIMHIRERVRSGRLKLLRNAGEMVRQTVDEIIEKALGLGPEARATAADVTPMNLFEVIQPARGKSKKIRNDIEKLRRAYDEKLARRARQIDAMKATLGGAPLISGDVLEFLLNMRDGPAKNIERLGDLCRLAAERVTCEASAREYGINGDVMRSMIGAVQRLCGEPTDPIWAKKRAQDIKRIPLPEVEWTRRLVQAHIMADAAMLQRVSEIHASVMREPNTRVPASVVRNIDETIGSFGRRVLLQNITHALGVTAGHWYACPNGHLYVIGDCGGAMMRSRCPDCGAVIGGENHRVVDSNNTAAGLVQPGAQAAWPMGR